MDKRKAQAWAAVILATASGVGLVAALLIALTSDQDRETIIVEIVTILGLVATGLASGWVLTKNDKGDDDPHQGQ